MVAEQEAQFLQPLDFLFRDLGRRHRRVDGDGIPFRRPDSGGTSAWRRPAAIAEFVSARGKVLFEAKEDLRVLLAANRLWRSFAAVERSFIPTGGRALAACAG